MDLTEEGRRTENGEAYEKGKWKNQIKWKNTEHDQTTNNMTTSYKKKVEEVLVMEKWGMLRFRNGRKES